MAARACRGRSDSPGIDACRAEPVHDRRRQVECHAVGALALDDESRWRLHGPRVVAKFFHHFWADFETTWTDVGPDRSVQVGSKGALACECLDRALHYSGCDAAPSGVQDRDRLMR